MMIVALTATAYDDRLELDAYLAPLAQRDIRPTGGVIW